MATAKTHTGLYWGKTSFCLVESSKGQILKASCAPIEEALGSDSEAIPDGLKYTNILQKLFLDAQLTNRQAVLSLPTKELIFRSFVIPWMAPTEVKGVVEFEVTKYVPIKVDELIYTFHTIPFEKDKLKSLRVIFVAIRKKVLDKYTEILQHSDIAVSSIEPAAVSIFRLLKKQKLIPRDHATAVVLIEDNSIHIILIDEDVVQFVRESPFTFDVSLSEQFVSRLFTDLRVSINFFTRQNSTAKVKRIFLISKHSLTDVLASIEDDFKIPVQEIPASKLTKQEDIPSLGFLGAFGASLKTRVLTSKDFNIGQESADLVSTSTAIQFNIGRYKPFFVSAALCALVIFAVTNFFNNQTRNQTQRLEELKVELGPYKSMQKPDIENLTQEMTQKIANYKNVRTQSHVKRYLYRIPALMPYGMWLKSIKVRYEAPKPSANKSLNAEEGEHPRQFIELQGYVYQDNINDQFKLINQFYSAIKEQDEFKDAFKNIDLKTRQEEYRNFQVSFFVITCNS